MKKVKCRVCAHTNGKFCKIKKVSVAQNKSRRCAEFEYAPEKVTIKTKVKSTYVPYYLTSRKAYKKYVEQQQKELLQENVEEKVEKLSNPDILSRFRSNVED